jgi:hypothetical protein
MISWLKQNYGDRLSTNASEKAELDFLRGVIPQLNNDIEDIQQELAKAGKDPDESSYSDDDEGEEVADLPIAVGTQGAKGPRMSVSAEVFGKFNQK